MGVLQTSLGSEDLGIGCHLGGKNWRSHSRAMVLLAKIVNGADTDNSLWNQPEAAGLNAAVTEQLD